MMNVWERVKCLDGKTLLTVAQKKPFDVVGVMEDRIQFVPRGGKGTLRWFSRGGIEFIYELNLPMSQLTPSRVQQEYPGDQNASYVVAIIQAINEL